MDNIYIYLVKTEPGIDEAVVPCLDGYTVYLNKDLTAEDLIKAYEHAKYHIDNGDCWNETMTASAKEFRAHHLRQERR